MDDECLLRILHSKRGERHRLSDQQASDDFFRLLKLHVPEKWSLSVDNLQQWCDDRRQMDVQVHMHHWLHGWLLLHVPLSFALIVITFWHAYVTLVYL